MILQCFEFVSPSTIPDALFMIRSSCLVTGLLQDLLKIDATYCMYLQSDSDGAEFFTESGLYISYDMK